MITAIVLAAGMSRRMGKNKLLLPFSGKTMLEATIDHILAAGALETIVVTGHDAEHIRPLLDSRPVKVVFNPDFSSGMTSSIQAGIRAAAADSTGYMICLADMPLIEPAVYRLLAQTFEEHPVKMPRLILQPEYRGQAGNPVVFSGFFRAALLALDAPEGGKPVVQANRDCLLRIPVDTDAVLRDADTPEAYEAIKAV